MGTPQKVAVIGLGSMGYGIAASILRAGHRTWGFDVVPAQAERFRAEGGAAGTLAAVAGELDAAVVVVLNAAQTEAVLFGADGVAARLRPGARGRRLRDGAAGLRAGDGGALRRGRRALPRRADLRRLGSRRPRGG